MAAKPTGVKAEGNPLDRGVIYDVFNRAYLHGAALPAVVIGFTKTPVYCVVEFPNGDVKVYNSKGQHAERNFIDHLTQLETTNPKSVPADSTYTLYLSYSCCTAESRCIQSLGEYLDKHPRITFNIVAAGPHGIERLTCRIENEMEKDSHKYCLLEQEKYENEVKKERVENKIKLRLACAKDLGMNIAGRNERISLRAFNQQDWKGLVRMLNCSTTCYHSRNKAHMFEIGSENSLQGDKLKFNPNVYCNTLLSDHDYNKAPKHTSRTREVEDMCAAIDFKYVLQQSQARLKFLQIKKRETERKYEQRQRHEKQHTSSSDSDADSDAESDTDENLSQHMQDSTKNERRRKMK